MKASIVCSFIAVVITLSTSLPARERTGAESPRTRRLALAPAPLDAAAQNHTLFAGPEDRTDGDGAAHYDKAARALPTNLDPMRIRDWLDAPLDSFPEADAERVLQKAQVSLQQLRQGAACKDCTWPPFTPGTMPANLREYRALIYLLCLETRLQMVQGQYDEALAAIQTGLAAAKHVGEAPTLVQGNVGVAMAAMTLRCVEDMVQTANSPNLHAALEDVPEPLIDLEIPIAAELNSLASNKQYNPLARTMMRRQMEQAYTRARQLMYRLDGTVAALQGIEGLRHYAATHAGQLPAQLSDITEVVVPDDPASGKPFSYRREDAKAVLDAAAPKGGRPRDAVRYEITVAR